jgi:hypothetical protein
MLLVVGRPRTCTGVGGLRPRAPTGAPQRGAGSAGPCGSGRLRGVAASGCRAGNVLRPGFCQRLLGGERGPVVHVGHLLPVRGLAGPGGTRGGRHGAGYADAPCWCGLAVWASVPGFAAARWPAGRRHGRLAHLRCRRWGRRSPEPRLPRPGGCAPGEARVVPAPGWPARLVRHFVERVGVIRAQVDAEENDDDEDDQDHSCEQNSDHQTIP